MLLLTLDARHSHNVPENHAKSPDQERLFAAAYSAGAT